MSSQLIHFKNYPARWSRQICRCYHSGRSGVHGHRPDIPNLLKSSVGEARSKNEAVNFFRLVENFRTHGHRAASLNPLGNSNDAGDPVPEISLDRFSNLEQFSPEGMVYWKEIEGKQTVSPSEGIDLLQRTYAATTGFEFMHLEEEVEREWLAKQIESSYLDPIPNEYRTNLAIEMAKFQNFDHFMANKFPNVKRYGGEGAESMVAFFLQLLNYSPEIGIDHLIIGMAHRGRLNLLTNLFQFPPSRMFNKIKGNSELPADARATGDVLSHLFTTVDIPSGNNRSVHVSLLPNPSHLEIVGPVAVGKARAKMQSLNCYDYGNDSDANVNPRVLPVQIHGDAALQGQGCNQETLGFANVPHYRVGGSLHFIVNNQIGFTTPMERGRSSRYASDIGKMIACPVFHVNGDSPEDLFKCTRLALQYRQTFHKDVFIDLMCFRRWGHNEVDDPTFTNPLIYKLIHARKSIPDVYCDKLVDEGLLDRSHLKETIEQHTAHLNEELKKADTFQPPQFYFQKQWSGISQAGNVITDWDTGVEIPLLKYIGHKSVEFPTDFDVHPHLAKTFVKARLAKVTEGEKIDWATAEAMAIGSLLYQGFNVRISGEDVGRGTFSQRHGMLVDQTTGEIFIPLNSLVSPEDVPNGQTIGKFEIANSTLSEESVLAFEYGYSIEHPDNLVIWEAQFGDFFNGAQIPVDVMVGSGETKWMLHNSMVMLLPHGMDGTGPEHSSCRFERFLQLTDSNEEGIVDGDYNNMQVVNPTTPAQYFHLLRRQMLRNFRKPLIVIAPKTLLRLSAATSNLTEMSSGTSFQPVVDDPVAKPVAKHIRKLILVTGKHYYALDEKRKELKRDDVAIVRIESLCPFPVRELQEIIQTYSNASEIVWSQEEHMNMGAWTFIKPRFENFIGRKIKYKGRGPSATPAVGIGRVHRAEVEQILNTTFN